MEGVFPKKWYEMMRGNILSLLCGVGILLLAVGCVEDEKFSTPAGARLTFSTDTVTMDTVIAGSGSITRQFSIHNNSGEGISITDIGFLNNEADGFSVLVDGVRVGETLGTSIDCRSKDSLLAFVKITPTESGQDEKVLHEAVLVFTLANGVQQRVVLQAYGQDVIWLNDTHISKNTVLDARRPYVVRDSLMVDEGVTLTLQAGVRLMFRSNGFLRVDGTLVTNGTAEDPVVLRGDRMDYMFTNQPYDRISGQWKGVILTSKSYGNHLQYCDIHSGSYGILCEESDTTKEKLRLENSVIHNVTGTGLETYNAKIFVGNTQISNAGGNCVCLYGGSNEFVHCTIAQFYPFSGLRGAALYYSNVLGNKKYSLEKAQFTNCIITGYSEDEIMGEREDLYDSGKFNYAFSHCLLDTPETVDDNINNVVWDKKPHSVYREGNFRKFDLDALSYDFQLDSLSSAIGIADIAATRKYYPYDRCGKPRLADGASDAGCYER